MDEIFYSSRWLAALGVSTICQHNFGNNRPINNFRVIGTIFRTMGGGSRACVMAFQLETHREWLWALVILILPHVNCHENEITCSCRIIVCVTVYCFIVHHNVVVHFCLCLKLLQNNGTYKKNNWCGGRIIGRNAKICRIE